MFVASTLQRWGARFVEADAELLAVELVRHSVQACGVMDPDVRLYELHYLNVIHVRLLGFERTIGIEVWDNASEPAELPADEQGRRAAWPRLGRRAGQRLGVVRHAAGQGGVG